MKKTLIIWLAALFSAAVLASSFRSFPSMTPAHPSPSPQTEDELAETNGELVLKSVAIFRNETSGIYRPLQLQEEKVYKGADLRIPTIDREAFQRLFVALPQSVSSAVWRLENSKATDAWSPELLAEANDKPSTAWHAKLYLSDPIRQAGSGNTYILYAVSNAPGHGEKALLKFQAGKNGEMLFEEKIFILTASGIQSGFTPRHQTKTSPPQAPPTP